MVDIESFEHLRVHATVLDQDGTIVRVNQGWREFARENRLDTPNFGVGSNYLQLCREVLGPRHRLCLDLEALLEGRSALLSWTYPCHSPDRRRWFNLIGVPARTEGAVLLHVDITGFVPTQALDEGPVPETSRAALSPTILDLQPWLRILPSANGASPRESGDDERRVLRDPTEAKGLRAGRSKPLTARQQEVLFLLSTGKTNAQIAKTLHLSPNTVRAHVSAILKRLNLGSRTEAAVYSLGPSPHNVSARPFRQSPRRSRSR